MIQFLVGVLFFAQGLMCEELPYNPYPRTCTVPEGVNESCKKALQADCAEILTCMDNKECIANRLRVDISSCDDEASSATAKPKFGTNEARYDGGQPAESTPAKSAKSAPSAIQATPESQSSILADQPDSQPCMTALSNARRACDASQASSFGQQVSGGSQGLTGAAVATTGTQNVNNILVNCSNSQQICASACSIAQLPDVQNECQRLESNLKYLAQSADSSFDSASNELSHFPPSSPYYLEKKQNSNFTTARDAAINREARARDQANQQLKPSQFDLSPAESPASTAFTNESPSTSDDGSTIQPNGNPSQDNYALETSLGIPRPYATGIASALINGSAPEGTNGSTLNGNKFPAAHAQNAKADLKIGGDGYLPPSYAAIGKDPELELNSYARINSAEKLKKGFSIFANWRSSIRELYEDFMRDPKTKSRNPAAHERGRLGIDTQLAMEPLPDAPRSNFPEVAFGATILSLSAIGLWRLKTLLALKGALKAAQLADQAQRRLTQRRSAEAPDRRIQSSLFREGEVERRKSSGDRRHQQRAERRSASRTG